MDMRLGMLISTAGAMKVNDPQGKLRDLGVEFGCVHCICVRARVRMISGVLVLSTPVNQKPKKLDRPGFECPSTLDANSCTGGHRVYADSEPAPKRTHEVMLLALLAGAASLARGPP